MKFLYWLLILLITCAMPLACYARGVSITASGGSPIPAAYDATSSQTQANFDCQGNRAQVLNQTETVLAYGFGSSTAVPAFDYGFIPPGANSGRAVYPKGGVSGRIYIRGVSSITTGTVQVECTNEE